MSLQETVDLDKVLRVRFCLVINRFIMEGFERMGELVGDVERRKKKMDKDSADARGYSRAFHCPPGSPAAQRRASETARDNTRFYTELINDFLRRLFGEEFEDLRSIYVNFWLHIDEGYFRFHVSREMTEEQENKLREVGCDLRISTKNHFGDDPVPKKYFIRIPFEVFAEVMGIEWDDPVAVSQELREQVEGRITALNGLLDGDIVGTVAGNIRLLVAELENSHRDVTAELKTAKTDAKRTDARSVRRSIREALDNQILKNLGLV